MKSASLKKGITQGVERLFVFDPQIARRAETPGLVRWSHGYCGQCKGNTDWRESRSFVAPKNGHVPTQKEIQVGWMCSGCGTQADL